MVILSGGNRHVPSGSTNNDTNSASGDPYTSGNRYIPNYQPHQSVSTGASDPLTGAGRYIPGSQQPSVEFTKGKNQNAFINLCLILDPECLCLLS